MQQGRNYDTTLLHWCDDLLMFSLEMYACGWDYAEWGCTVTVYNLNMWSLAKGQYIVEWPLTGAPPNNDIDKIGRPPI